MLFVFSYSLLYAQNDSGRVTFHVKAIDRKNGIDFSVQCEEKYREIFIDKKGNAYFFWGKPDNPISASFSSDTASINIVKNIITPAFIDKLLNCCAKYNCPDTDCGYFTYINENGKATHFAAIDLNYSGNDKCGSDKLNRLIKMLDTFYNRYAFPK